MAISALVLSAFLAPAIASAQPSDGGVPPPVPVPDGGLMRGTDPGVSPSPKSTPKDSKAKKGHDDSGSEGSTGSGSSSGGSSGKSAHGNVDAGTSSS
jgi:hypothetical protein